MSSTSLCRKPLLIRLVGFCFATFTKQLFYMENELRKERRRKNGDARTKKKGGEGWEEKCRGGEEGDGGSPPLTRFLWSDYRLAGDFESGTMNVTCSATYLQACHICSEVCRRLTHEPVGITGMFLPCRFRTYQRKTCVMTTCHVLRSWFVCIWIIRVILTEKVPRNEAFDRQNQVPKRKLELLNFCGKHKGFQEQQETEKDRSTPLRRAEK